MTTSMAPGHFPTPQSLLSPQDLRAASETALAHTAAAILGEQHRRALSDSDLGSLVEEAFATGFTMDGKPRPPWIAGGLLFCPGWIRYRSRTSHDCEFISVGETWVWECPQVAVDDIRQVPGAKVVKQSITVVTPVEGMTLDQVAASSKQGSACQMSKATSYLVRAGELVAVKTRARVTGGHNRS